MDVHLQNKNHFFLNQQHQLNERVLKCLDCLEELNSVVTDYIHFFVDCVFQNKTFRVFPNDVPWVNKELKLALKRKKTAFEQGDISKMKDTQKQIRQIISDNKQKYKQCIEAQMRGNYLRQARGVHNDWEG